MGAYSSGDAGKGNMMYDDAAFQSFLFSLLAVYCIPTLLVRAHRLRRRRAKATKPLEQARHAWCTCSLCQHNKHRLQAARKRFAAHDLFLICATLLLVYTAKNVYNANLNVEPPFDPFQILGVSESATVKHIKRAYRRLSVIHHPDKNPGDPQAADRFIKITKAHAALTDPVAKENFIKYGNPDGRLTTILGVGLPPWVAESHNIILATYFVSLVIVFPLVVGIWWHRRSKELTSDIYADTFQLYRETMQQTGRIRDLLGAFCGSFEFRHLYKPENNDAIVELHDTLRRAGRTELKTIKTVIKPTPVHEQNLLVMSAYLARLPIPKQLQYVKERMLAKVEPLMTALTDTVGVFQRPDCQAAWNRTFVHGHTIYMANAIVLTQSLIQALDEKSSPLMQIPHITEKEVRYCLNSRSPVIKNIYDLKKLQMAEQRHVLRGLSDDELLDVKAFLDRFPMATLNVSEAKVEGEDDSTVHAGDNVTIRVKLTVMRSSGSVFSPHTPNVPVRKEEAWWIWLADERLRCPIDVKRLTSKMAKGHGVKKKHRQCFGEECAEESADEVSELDTGLLKDPRVTRFVVKFRFRAPRAGSYNLEVKAACDCYNGASKAAVVKMKVEEEVEPPGEDAVKYFDTDDESSEEESSEEEEEEEEENSEDEYEYIEVTDEESEAGDFEDEDDEHGISAAPHGDAAS
ncbi:Translocation protein SEC63-like [Gracilariopsis chorda]|uniref:Translocation protein SEC63-like n=1 Tax=Gracilariopsis chorda TaxID=448386 RepID=A0A2V3IX59_9FLOR|nr:Translocation protein SEC63-like [Gracilariopsis chorda]|eukprot:PXF46689.1 Translocation protein SEC63-like [Gracilariopsis chorda]